MPDSRPLGQSGSRDLAPLSTRPGYNANPNDWVRYANHLEAELDRFRGPLMTEAYSEIARLSAELEKRDIERELEDAIDRVAAENERDA